MSDLSSGLTDAIERAVAEHLAVTGGGMVSGWHFVADLIDADGEPSWVYATAPNQRASTTMGLIEWARGIGQYEQRRHLDELDD